MEGKDQVIFDTPFMKQIYGESMNKILQAFWIY